jgi:antirestriction protein
MSTSTSIQNDSNPQWVNIKLTKATIASQGNKVRLVDSDPDNKLDIYCYVRCTPTTDSAVKSCRGVVVKEGNVVLQTYPYTQEYGTGDLEEVQALTSPDVSGLRVFDAHEGSLLRLFSDNEKWYVSTHRKLDAFRSKWASRQSFGEQFMEALKAEYENNENFKNKMDLVTPSENFKVHTIRDSGAISTNELFNKFCTSLDKTKCYCFLVRNTAENRIVCKNPSRPTMYSAGAFKLRDFDYFSLDEDTGIPSAKEHKFESWEKIQEYVEGSSEDELQGIIVFSGKKHAKIFNEVYTECFNIRGNEPSIKFRYLQLRMDKEKTDKLYALYPRHTDTFEEYENILYNVAKIVYEAYVQRFIKKKYVTLPKEQYQIMRNCHSWHLEDRLKNRISLRKVIELMNKQEATSLNRMIRTHIQELKNPETKTETETETKTETKTETETEN